MTFQLIKVSEIEQTTFKTQPKLLDFCLLGSSRKTRFDIEEEYRIHFCHPKGPRNSFKKPDKDDKAWVLFHDILKVLKPTEL
ncbi:hypothetical protein PR048_026402, partial [Dryococelus australis]